MSDINAVELAQQLEDLASVSSKLALVVEQLVRERDQAKLQLSAVIADMGRIADLLGTKPDMRCVRVEAEQFKIDREILRKLSNFDKLNEEQLQRLHALAELAR